MAGGRIYYVPIENVAIGTAVQDIFSFKCTAGGLILHWIQLGSTNAAAASLRMRLRRATATITLGSAGTAPTPAAASANNSVAAATTAHINDTTQATTSGAFTTMAGFNWDTVLPFDFMPAPEDRIDCILNQGLVLDLATTIVAVTISGLACFEEVP